MLLNGIAHLDALISSGSGALSLATKTSLSSFYPRQKPDSGTFRFGCVRLIDRRTIFIGTIRSSELPTDQPAACPSRHETNSGRPDEDEQDMSNGICHLFGILYSGHLLFPKYVPTR